MYTVGMFNDIGVSPLVASKMQVHYTLLTEAKINLTAISEPSEIVEKHFLDSLSALELINDGARVLDVGTGAGFPALPLASAQPNAEFLLVDATKKKTDFLDKVIAEGGYTNAQTLCGRAEDLAKTDLRQSFDIVVSRAVKSLNVLLELCVPFLKTGGILIAYKAINAQKEVEEAKNALKTLNASVEEMKSYTLGGYTRVLVIVKKMGETDSKYPRSYTSILKKPL